HAGAALALTNTLKSTAEAVYSLSGLVSGRVGTEWNPMDMVSLRTGYKTETLKGLSPLAGLTVGMGLHLWGQEFAYAWLPYGDLGDTQYFSRLLKFGAEGEKNRNLIRYQAQQKISPPNEYNVIQNINPDDPEYKQLIQLLSDQPEAERNALAPSVGTDR